MASAPRLSAQNRLWNVCPPPSPEFVAAFRQYSPLLATLLHQRGLHTPAEIAAFVAADYRAGLHDPFRLRGMEVAARRIAMAIHNHEPIAVYGDFDTDGVTAVTLLVQAIGAMGGNIRPYIPHRLREGYGLNTEAIDTLAADGIRLLLTVDCGISNVQETVHARALGIDVIITDHHAPPPALPDALAIVNPRQPGCSYPFKQLVGVGIAYQLVRALLRLGFRPSLQKDDLLDVVALGTVTDMGPLIGENRVLVKHGLAAINDTSRPGLRALIAAAGLTPGRITSTDISFGLGPRLNAAGRIDDAQLSYQLLLAQEFDVAQELASQLNLQNRQRQELSKTVQQAARAQIEAQGKQNHRIIIVDGAEYPAGVVGLVAARLVEELGRPILLLERGERVSRGSARSTAEFNIIDALTNCADLFERYGGHAAAAGFTIATARLAELEARLLRHAELHLPETAPVPQIEIHAETPLRSLSWDLLAELATLEPFGQANPQPVLMSRGVRVTGAWPRGMEGQHLKLRLEDAEGTGPYDAIAFRLGHLARHFERSPWIDIVYTLEANEWNGNRTLQLNIKDLRRAQ